MKQLKTLIVLLLTVAAMASCMKSSSSDITLYDDAAIKAFTLGTVNCYTTVSTADTTYTKKTAYVGSVYRFTIDQIATAEHVDGLDVKARHIYNKDSLPVGSDITHILCTVTTVNNGAATVYEPESEAFFYANDSIDFSRPRLFRVYSSDGTGYSDYVVNVNVHKEKGDEFVWTLMENVPMPDDQPQSLPEGIKQLLGGSTTEQYALSTDNHLMVWNAGENQWTADSLDSDPSLLPTEDCSLVSYPMKYSSETDYVLLVGNRKEQQTGSSTEWTSVVWRKIVDYGRYGQRMPWVYMERETDALYRLPYLKGLNIVSYDDGVLAFGGDYKKIYQSRDNGITWKENSLYKMPEGFDYNATAVTVATDDDNYIWLYCAGTGQVWRGRLNRLGWTAPNN